MPSFNQSQHANDLALIRLDQTVPEYRVIEMCQYYPASFDTRAVSVGVGSTTQADLTPTGYLREITLRLSPLQIIDSWLNSEICPMSLVCTETTDENSGLCYNDDGNPLFLRDCETRNHICLLGIATPTLKDESPLRDCKGQADFTSIPHFHDWIFTTIALNMD